jgi:hypothetical protein
MVKIGVPDGFIAAVCGRCADLHIGCICSTTAAHGTLARQESLLVVWRPYEGILGESLIGLNVHENSTDAEFL